MRGKMTKLPQVPQSRQKTGETVPCGAPEDNVRGSVSSTMKQQRVKVETDVILRSETHVKEKVKVLSNWQAPPSHAEQVHFSFL